MDVDKPFPPVTFRSLNKPSESHITTQLNRRTLDDLMATLICVFSVYLSLCKGIITASV